MNGRRTSRDRLETCLAAIADPAGEGTRTFLKLYPEEARAEADAADARARFGHSLGPLDGLVVSIKDLFDVKGDVTRAGTVERIEIWSPSRWLETQKTARTPDAQAQLAARLHQLL